MRPSRKIRVYISSPFRGMQAERDTLADIVVPQIRTYCEERGFQFELVDLRSRAATADEATAEAYVLAHFAEEIEGCLPCFVALLGDQYGWIPSEIPDQIKRKTPWLADPKCASKSVNELEILHGALRNPGSAKGAFVYLRDPAIRSSGSDLGADTIPPPTAEEREKLFLLKDAVRRSGVPVRENYSDPVALGELVLTDLTLVVDGLISAGPKTAQLSTADVDRLLAQISIAPAVAEPAEHDESPVEAADDAQSFPVAAPNVQESAPQEPLSATTPRLILTHLSGSKAGTVQEFAVGPKKEVWVGRDPVSHVRYAETDKSVSRAHLKIVQNFGDPNAYIIISRGRNGTLINNVEIAESSGVRDGDLVQVGRGGPVFRFQQYPKPQDRPVLHPGEGTDDDTPLPPDPTMAGIKSGADSATTDLRSDPRAMAALNATAQGDQRTTQPVILKEDTESGIYPSRPSDQIEFEDDPPTRWLYGALIALAFVVVGVLVLLLRHKK